MVQVVDFRRRCSILLAIEQNCETQEEDMMAESNVGSISIKDMILAPAVITLAVTILRLTGELNGWSPVLFSPEAGGGAALVGITWLVPVFGVYFALKLARSGSAPVSSGRVLAHAAAGLAAAVAIILGGGYLVGENYPVAMLVPAAAGIAGDRWSLGFVVETERQVVEHLDDHLSRLPDGDRRSRALLRRMQADEQQHATRARAAGGAPLPPVVRRAMRAASKVMTRTAYWI